ncbi:sigma factor-like helix-turn-helix DNA-binding protein [Streptomyces sp. YS415]|uniref:sigma factor-like helix-turn-helix DNA-binding protein n=1 Tax=Streptomyces sp. YS415 TaxID=2944806 RepID=UPI00201FB718|nr:sigma factor-like helix-turn-helix DNA-binding protein [Streptomyces sp. YS415]MCL7425339.1 hypothetical protein [Streptomyces sp. YS415]
MYALHGGATLRYASRPLGGDWYLAEDILQEAVLRASTVLATLEVSVPDPTDRLLRGRLALDAVSELTEQQRQAIGLLYHGRFNAAQAAEHLGIPVGTVKSRSYYALRAARPEAGLGGSWRGHGRRPVT